MRLRPASEADAPNIAATLVDAFDGYREFAPPGWEPPPADEVLADLRPFLAEPGTWCTVAAPPGGGHAGHVAFLPANRARHPDPDPSLAHFWMLFVHREFWGTGLAVRLHDAAVEEAAGRGFSMMRLGVAEGQARARRFYERAGWRQSTEPFVEEGLGLRIVEYRLVLPAA